MLRKPSYFFVMNIFSFKVYCKLQDRKKNLNHTIKTAWSRKFLETPEAVFLGTLEVWRCNHSETGYQHIQGPLEYSDGDTPKIDTSNGHQFWYVLESATRPQVKPNLEKVCCTATYRFYSEPKWILLELERF